MPRPMIQAQTNCRWNFAAIFVEKKVNEWHKAVPLSNPTFGNFVSATFDPFQKGPDELLGNYLKFLQTTNFVGEFLSLALSLSLFLS